MCSALSDLVLGSSGTFRIANVVEDSMQRKHYLSQRRGACLHGMFLRLSPILFEPFQHEGEVRCIQS